MPEYLPLREYQQSIVLFSELFGGRLHHTRQHLLGQHISIYSTSRLVRILIRESLDNEFSKIPNQDETGTGAASIVQPCTARNVTAMPVV
jgi:hypothetical protein